MFLFGIYCEASISDFVITFRWSSLGSKTILLKYSCTFTGSESSWDLSAEQKYSGLCGNTQMGNSLLLAAPEDRGLETVSLNILHVH